jgi:hypothetical protein
LDPHWRLRPAFRGGHRPGAASARPARPRWSVAGRSVRGGGGCRPVTAIFTKERWRWVACQFKNAGAMACQFKNARGGVKRSLGECEALQGHCAAPLLPSTYPSARITPPTCCTTCTLTTAYELLLRTYVAAFVRSCSAGELVQASLSKDLARGALLRRMRAMTHRADVCCTVCVSRNDLCRS